MCNNNEFYVCEHCGNLIEMIHDAGVSDQRHPLGRQFLSENARWQGEEIQRLRQDERRMRKATRRIDC